MYVVLSEQSEYGIFTYIYTTFSIKISKIWIDIPYMDDMGYNPVIESTFN